MRRFSVVTAGALALAGLLGAAGSSLGASLIVNGSFEQGGPFVDSGMGSWMQLPTGSTLVTGWTVTSSVDWNYLWVAASDGIYDIDLNHSGPGGIQQAFATDAGGTYAVTFALAGNPYSGIVLGANTGPVIKSGRVSAAGQTQNFSFDITGHTQANPGWVDTTFYFTATGAQTTLLFEGLNDGSAGPVIDNVRVTAVPVPAAAWAGLGMLGSMGAWRLRRRRS